MPYICMGMRQSWRHYEWSTDRWIVSNMRAYFGIPRNLASGWSDRLASTLLKESRSRSSEHSLKLMRDVAYTVQPDEVEHIDDLELKLVLTWSTGGDNLTRFHIGQQTHLCLKYPELHGLDDILIDTNGFQDLITLAADAPTVPTEIKLWRTGLNREYAPGRFMPQAIEFFVANAAEQVRQDSPQQPERMFFLLDRIGGLKTVGQWLGVSRTYRIVLGSLLTVRYSARLYEENRYQNVISAAETFHRMRFPNYVMPATDFKAYRRKLVKVVGLAVGKKAAEWLMNQLLFSNEPRLRQRLEVLAEYAGAGFAAIVGDVQSWSAIAVTLRNRLTHHDAGRNIRGTPEDLPFLTDSIYLLVMMCLLRECIVPEEVLENIQNSERIKFLKINVADTVDRYREHIHRG
jgi:ApeA N-terminal domain 1